MVVTKKTSAKKAKKASKTVKSVEDVKVVETSNETKEVKEVSSKPVQKKKTASKKKTSSKKEVVQEPVQEQVQESVQEPAQESVQEPAQETKTEKVSEVVQESSSEGLDEQEESFDKLCSFVVELQQQLRTLSNDIRNLRRKYKKEVSVLRKQAAKKTRKPSNPDKKREPSGFAKDTFISNELREFLGVPHGTLISRPKVTKRITEYIRNNNLYCKDNKKVIVPDEKLGALLKHGDNEVTYFTLQKFMKVHYPKEQPAQDSETTTPVVVV